MTPLATRDIFVQKNINKLNLKEFCVKVWKRRERDTFAD